MTAFAAVASGSSGIDASLDDVRRNCASVTFADLLQGFREAGIVVGDTVLVHASMSRFGYVEGGADTLLEALLTSVGTSGTLAMPGFTFQLAERPHPVFDVRTTPCWASQVYERFRTRAPVCRSHHVTHSVCAVGARAAELTANHSVTPCGAGSPFENYVTWGGKILLLGVSHNRNSMFHAVEEHEKLSYVGFRAISGATIIDERGNQHPIATEVHDMHKPRDYNRMNAVFARSGIQQEVAVGSAIVRCLDARRMFDATVQAVRADPEALVRHGAEPIHVPVSVHETAATDRR